MFRDHKISRTVIAIGLYASLTFGAACAHGEEGKSFWTGIKEGISLGLQYELGNLRIDVPSEAIPVQAYRVHRVTVGQGVIVRKIASEEFELQEGGTLHSSRGSTLQRGVSLSRSFEWLVGGGVEVGASGETHAGVNAGLTAGIKAGITTALKADIGARVAEILGNEINESSSLGLVAELDGKVLERARVDWYARIFSGKAILEAGGVTRELPFEYIVGYDARITGTPRRRPTISAGPPAAVVETAVDSSLPRLGRVTAVSKEWARLFEARFETTVNTAKGERLPVYRGRLVPKCIGCCKVVAVQDCQIVAECEGFTPQVGDAIGGPVAE